MISIIIQILSLLLAILIIAKSYISYKRKEESLIMALFWSITWLAVVFFAYFPDIPIGLLSSKLKSDAGLGTVLGTGLVFIYFIVYRIYIKAERNENQLRKLISDIAVKNFKKHYRKKRPK